MPSSVAARSVATDIPTVVDVEDSMSPVSALTQQQEQERGITCSVAPASEKAPYVPEHFRAMHKIIRMTGVRGNCAAKDCTGKVANKCAKCSFEKDKPIFYCNGECNGNKPPRWCYYAHLCEHFAGDFNDATFHSDLKKWNKCRHRNGKAIDKDIDKDIDEEH